MSAVWPFLGHCFPWVDERPWRWRRRRRSRGVKILDLEENQENDTSGQDVNKEFGWAERPVWNVSITTGFRWSSGHGKCRKGGNDDWDWSELFRWISHTCIVICASGIALLDVCLGMHASGLRPRKHGLRFAPWDANFYRTKFSYLAVYGSNHTFKQWNRFYIPLDCLGLPVNFSSTVIWSSLFNKLQDWNL